MWNAIALTYATGQLIAALMFTAFEIWEWSKNNERWFWLHYFTRLILIAGLWPLFLCAYVAMALETWRQRDRKA